MKRILKSSLLLAATVLLVLSFTSPIFAVGAGSSSFDAVDAYVEDFLREQRIPGVALAVVEGDEVVYARGYGVADPSGRPVTAQTPFIIGSTGKSFTALAVMQLVETGKVDLDAPVRQYLPWFDLGDGAITVRHLLNHTSGIPVGVGQESLTSNDSDAGALERHVREINESQLAHRPGTTHEYANANYQIAGMIVQTVSEQSFEAYMQRSILDPLEMGCSYTSKVEAQEHGLAGGYHYWFGFPFPAGDTPYPRQRMPSGYLISCAEDMGKALIPHLNGGAYHGVQLLSADGIAELHRPALAGYAMGWQTSYFGVLHHSGAVPDYGSEILLYPRKNLGIAVLFNINNAIGAEPVYILPWNVLNLLIGSRLAETPTRSTYLSYLAAILVMLAAAVPWIFASRAWVRRWKKQPEKRPAGSRAAISLGIPVILEVVLAVAIFRLFMSTSYGLRNALLHQPDLTILLLIWMALVLANSFVRTLAAARLLGLAERPRVLNVSASGEADR
jgi:CubicO group peptidase (beta-lactamase class C family)